MRMPQCDVIIHLLLVVEIVGQRRMDLAEAQIGMLSLDLLGVPAVGDPVQRDHPDFDAGALDHGVPRRIELNVCVSFGCHGALDPPSVPKPLKKYDMPWRFAGVHREPSGSST